MELGLVQKIDIDREMQQAYLDYAMSVIVARALPDARDGLKPVHRRILYAMHDMAIRPDSPYKKSARIVGEVLGKYHPHGDMAVYDAMARMAQDFSMRYLLVDGQGNFGSVDGDPPAAMRYTEARLTNAAMQLLTDIGKNTVDFLDNFDGTLTEPTVLPSSLPNLLVNGATGIAVGMATSIPPHNLGEIIDAIQFLLQQWEKLDDIGVDDLLNFVHGPDFPTGGVILHGAGDDLLISAYSTGRGQVTLRASAHLEEMERGRSRIIVTELPYMTNKSSLIERIAELAREERITGIVDLRDESDRQGMRIVIELSKNCEPEAVLRDLYKHTPMQVTFSINMLALVNGEPRLLSLKQALRVYVEHRLEVIRRRSQYELDKARQRAHILEGLRVALKNLDEVIDMIRKAPDVETARSRLMKRFRLSEIQAQAILDMQLRRLAALERRKIEEEYKEVLGLIKQLDALLKSPRKMRDAVGEELQTVRDLFADRRRTHIVELKEGETKATLLTKTDLVPEKEIWISATMDGLVSRSVDDKLPRLSGKETPDWLVKTSTRDTLYLVTEQGEAAAFPVHSLPETEDPQGGIPFWKVSPLREEARLAGLFVLPARNTRVDTDPFFESHFILTATQTGFLKKSVFTELPGASANTFTLVKVNPGDRLGWIQITKGRDELLIVTANGMSIRFHEDEIRPMGLVAAGVLGIKLQPADAVIGLEVVPRSGELLLITQQGKAKRLPFDQFPLQGRYGQGVMAWKLAPGDRIVGCAVGRATSRAALHLNKLLPKPIRFDEAPLQNRSHRGASLPDWKSGLLVLRMTVPWEALRPEQEAVIAKSSRRTKSAPSKPAAAGRLSTPKAEAPRDNTTKKVTRPTRNASSEKPVENAAKAVGKATIKTASQTTTKPSPKTAAKTTTAAKAPATETLPEAAARSTPKSSPKTKAETKTAVKAPSAKTQSETVTQKASSPTAKTMTKTTVKTTAKPSARTPVKSRPVGKTEPKATAETTIKPTSMTLVKSRPAEKTAPKTVTRTPAKPSPKTTPKSSAAGKTSPKTTTKTAPGASPNKPAEVKTPGEVAPKTAGQTKTTGTTPDIPARKPASRTTNKPGATPLKSTKVAPKSKTSSEDK